MFEYAGQDTATVHISVNDGKSITNDIIYGTIKGLKIDRETGENIAGALFGLFSTDETEFTEETAILTAESNDEGIFEFTDVPYGDPLLIDDKEIPSETTITPAEPSGEVLVSFEFDARYIKKDTDIVVFESLYSEDKELAVHADIEDVGQTVTVKIPKIGTKASIDGKKEFTANGDITIDDVVSYKNLTVGKEYTISGVLMDKATGKPFLVDGKEVYSEVTFTPETADGEVTVSFTFDGSAITKDTEIVVFETLYREGTEIAVHADIDDKDQTVTIHPQPEPEKPQTGDNSNLGFYIGLGSVAVGGLIAFLIIKFKKKDEDDE